MAALYIYIHMNIGTYYILCSCAFLGARPMHRLCVDLFGRGNAQVHLLLNKFARVFLDFCDNIVLKG